MRSRTSGENCLIVAHRSILLGKRELFKIRQFNRNRPRVDKRGLREVINAPDHRGLRSIDPPSKSKERPFLIAFEDAGQPMAMYIELSLFDPQVHRLHEPGRCLLARRQQSLRTQTMCTPEVQ
jgi:hypothetical protein